jgi:uncharacterized RDD family membrane protein YckC
VAQDAVPSGRGQESYPGQRLGLTPSGRGSLATWGNRITALVVDWAASMAVAVLLFGSGVLTSDGWRAWMILAVFFGGSFGQLLAGLGIARLDAKPLGFVRAVIRAALVCLVVPALVVGADRRGLHDVAVGTMVIKRR